MLSIYTDLMSTHKDKVVTMLIDTSGFHKIQVFYHDNISQGISCILKSKRIQEIKKNW